MKKLFLLALFFVAVMVLVSCEDGPIVEPPVDPVVDYNPPAASELSRQSLNVSINYALGTSNQAFTEVGLSSISWVQNTPYPSTVDGHTYTKGDLLPVWQYISDRLNVELVDVAKTSDANTNAQWERLLSEGFQSVDLVNSTTTNIGAQGAIGKFINLAAYLDQMPNLKRFLDQNPAYKATLTASNGGIYATPYFDGLNEYEQAYLMRTDWVKDILDVADPAFDSTPAFKPTAYTFKQIPSGINTNVTVANLNGTTRVVHKAWTVNPIDVIKNAGDTGAAVATAFRAHMQATYGGQGYAKLSDVFVGTDACYDTDELIALMYVVKSNPRYLTREFATPADSVEVFFPRDNTAARVKNMLRALEMYGIKGSTPKVDYLYFDAQGNLHDARRDEALTDGVNNLNALYQDGLIPATIGGAGYNWAQEMVSQSIGFMEYDYTGSQTPIGWLTAGRAKDPTLEWQAVLPPIVNWKKTGEYFHFTEFVRNGKTEAWGIPSHVAGAKLNRALMLVDQLYNQTNRDAIGSVHLYGPAAWGTELIYESNDGLESKVYRLNTLARDEMTTLAAGSHINYLRRYLGATMPIGHIRNMGLEYQTLSDQGVASYDKLSLACKLDVFRLGGVSHKDDKWYSIPPIAFALTAADSTYISANFAPVNAIFGDSNLANLIKNGLTYATVTSAYTQEMYNNYVTAYNTAYQFALAQ